MYYKGIPNTDILGNKLQVGDKVTIFNNKFIAYENCTIVFKPYKLSIDDDGEDAVEERWAIQVDEGMWFFGLGNHEIIKEE